MIGIVAGDELTVVEADAIIKQQLDVIHDERTAVLVDTSSCAGQSRHMDDKAHRGGGQRRGKSHFIMVGFNKRPAGENKDKRGQKVNVSACRIRA